MLGAALLRRIIPLPRAVSCGGGGVGARLGLELPSLAAALKPLRGLVMNGGRGALVCDVALLLRAGGEMPS